MVRKVKATLDDLYRVPEHGKAELVDGELMRMAPAGFLPNRAAGAIYASLRAYERRLKRGYAVSDNAGFRVNLPHRESFSPDAAFQEALFRVYNDWIIEYCQKVSERLYGIALISMYDVDNAIAEMERCKKQGIVGTMIWQVPDPKLPFTAEHYERFWAASQDLELPVHLHILTGFGDSMNRQTSHGIQRYRIGAQQHREIEDALFDIIFSGVLERYPKLKIVSVENEVGWMPFWLGQCDKGFKRHRHREKIGIDKLPSEYFYRQVYATFFNDQVGGKLFSWWGVDNCMWSNDYPHQNSTWPNSRDVINRDMAHLSATDRDKLLNTNVRKLYNLNAPASLPVAA